MRFSGEVMSSSLFVLITGVRGMEFYELRHYRVLRSSSRLRQE
jgi:hypothetical protein